jgi:hypothetical protein
MKFRLQIVIETDDAMSRPPIELVTLQRDTLSLETLGLSLEEAREVLLSLQQQMTAHQVEDFICGTSYPARHSCPYLKRDLITS